MSKYTVCEDIYKERDHQEDLDMDGMKVLK
jgi:hypothetical protein